MKGFVRILEAVVASVILIASLSAFFTIPKKSDWDVALLQVQASDALVSLAKSGVLERHIRANDAAGMNTDLRRLVGETRDFSVTVEGMPNPLILMECVCTPEEALDVKAMFGIPADRDEVTFPYKGRTITIRGREATLDEAGTDPRAHIIFVYGYEDLQSGGQLRPTVRAFLERGGTLFMFSDLTQAQIEDGVMDAVFGLAVKSGRQRDAAFDEYDNIERPAFRISDYFVNSPVRVDTTATGEGTFFVRGRSEALRTDVVDGTECVRYPPNSNSPQNCHAEGTTFVVRGATIRVYDVDSRTDDDPERHADIGITDFDYRFEGFTAASEVESDSNTVVITGLDELSRVKISTSVFGRGRTVWFADYDEDSAPGHAETDFNQLMRAAVLWASGERFSMDTRLKPLPQQFFEYTYFGTLAEVEPFEIKLRVWKVFY